MERQGFADSRLGPIDEHSIVTESGLQAKNKTVKSTA